jgi:hypothetical protein
MRSAHAKAAAPLPTHMVRASHVCGRRGENMKTLTLSIDCSDDDCFVISATTLGGNKAFEAEFDRDVRYGQVLYQMDEAVDGKFALVLGNGCSLAELRHDFRCKDIPGLVSIPDKFKEQVDEEMPAIHQRDMRRKPVNDVQRRRMNDNRNKNKRTLREALQHAVSKSTSIVGAMSWQQPAGSSASSWWVHASPPMQLSSKAPFPKRTAPARYLNHPIGAKLPSKSLAPPALPIGARPNIPVPIGTPPAKRARW